MTQDTIWKGGKLDLRAKRTKPNLSSPPLQNFQFTDQLPLELKFMERLDS